MTASFPGTPEGVEQVASDEPARCAGLSDGRAVTTFYAEADGVFASATAPAVGSGRGREQFDWAESAWPQASTGESPFGDEAPQPEQSPALAEGPADADRPLLRQGSRGEAVTRAQLLLNRFLAVMAVGPGDCVDLSPRRVNEMITLLSTLRRNGQLPLVVDGRFGPSTEHATRLFQSCLGLARDGMIGPVTWHYLQRNQTPEPAPTPTCGVPERPPTELEHEHDLQHDTLNEATTSIANFDTSAQTSLASAAQRGAASVGAIALQSARFRGIPRFSDIHAGVTTAYLRFNDRGDEVRAVQHALIDLEYTIPSGATGFFGRETSDAVVSFKTKHRLYPNDAVVGQKTIAKLDEYFALPFADREEWLSWKARRLPQWNFTRLNELNRLNSGAAFTWNPLSGWLPPAFKNALASGVSQLLDPYGSPTAAYAPSATWGVSPLDLYHCHVALETGPTGMGQPFDNFVSPAVALKNRLASLSRQAESVAAHGTPAWKVAFRNLLLAPPPAGGRSYNQESADLLNELVSASMTSSKPVRLLWHTFEEPVTRPTGMVSTDPRRGWWCQVTPPLNAPNPHAVTALPFPNTRLDLNGVMDLLNLCFVVSQTRVITVIAGVEMDEVGVLVDLDFRDYKAARAGLP